MQANGPNRDLFSKSLTHLVQKGSVEVDIMAENKRQTFMGLIVYSGREIVETEKDIWAVPDWLLFGSL